MKHLLYYNRSQFKIFNQLILKLLTLCLLVNFYVFSTNITEMKETSQKAFIMGDYQNANRLFSNICIHPNSNKNEKKHAYRMKALIMEQYFGDIDSAIMTYEIYLKSYCTKQREIEITKDKLNFLNSLGDQKEIYGEFQRIIFTTKDDLTRTKELDKFNKRNISFIMRKDALKHCAIAGLNSQQYVISYKTYNIIKEEFPPLSETEEDQFSMSKRMYKRYRFTLIVFLTWLFGVFLFAFEMVNIFRKRTIITPSLLKTGTIGWFIILLTYWLIYKIKIINGDHNPFRISDMLLMSTVFTISILFNNMIQFSNHKRLYRILITVVTTMSILGTAYFSTYNRPDRINVMDDLYDQVGDIFIKDKNEKTGTNTQD